MWNDEAAKRGTVLIDDIAHPAMQLDDSAKTTIILIAGQWVGKSRLRNVAMSGFRPGYRSE